MFPRWVRPLALAGLLPLGMFALASPVDPPKAPNSPTLDLKIQGASDAGEKAISRFRIPKNLQTTLWAAEPQLANPVAFHIDNKGKIYVCETFRLHDGVTDTRGHQYWLDDDIACRTVEDRLAMYKKHLGKKFDTYGIYPERIRLLEDTKGTGRADKDTVFADGFNHPEDGIAAGVLAWRGDVYYTCIPDVWKLRDTKGTGVADKKESLSRGYGVHVQFLGHDLHGLRVGPDGRIYFSMADRGLNVTTKEGKKLFYPDMGTVLRCEPDGANLEVVAQGLRNPQELAFDNVGNLFSCDNNCDSGDKARWVEIVEGGDSGWRCGYQYASSLGDRGPWNSEKLWHLQHPGQAAYVLPPMAHVGDGPSGLTFYPGTGLEARYREHFFMADFRGGSGGSGIRSWANKPKGASFELVDSHEYIWNVLATDVDFGPDSALYLSDWTEGWNKPGRGRIYRFVDPDQQKLAVVAETRKILAEGFDKRSNDELLTLLHHPHQGVRQEAHLTLADKGKPALAGLGTVIATSKGTLARIHAIQAAGIIARRNAADDLVAKILTPLLGDADVKVRVAALKGMRELKVDVQPTLLGALKDADSRVKFAALLSLQNVTGGTAEGTKAAIYKVLDANENLDVYLRHAAVMALSANSTVPTLVAETANPSPFVRLACVLALRHKASAEVAAYLKDTDPSISIEAARTINDTSDSTAKALPALGALITSPLASPSMGFRVLNAHFRLGQAENALALATFAARSDASEALRVEALKMLAEWENPGRRDRITGLTQNLGKRDKNAAVVAFRSVLGSIFSGTDKVRSEAANVAAKLGIGEAGAALLTLLKDEKGSVTGRSEALKSLASLKDGKLKEATAYALASGEPKLRAAAVSVIASSPTEEAYTVLKKALETGEIVEKQNALGLIGNMKNAPSREILATWLVSLNEGKVPAELVLDVIDAAKKQGNAELASQVAKFDAARPKGDELAAWREALVGGDAAAGRNVFLNKTEVVCQKCHKAEGAGGEVGPNLDGIGKKQERLYLLESIVLPNKQIAKGFETVSILTTDGKTRAGILKSETKTEVVLMDGEGKLIKIPVADIEERRVGRTSMPEDIHTKLSKKEIRDLVEWLKGL